MTDAQAIYEAVDDVRRHYAEKFNKSSGVDQLIYGEIHDAIEMFQRGVEERIEVKRVFDPKHA